ncbi:hypothetical protein BZG30_31770 [Escherichia coli]|nr:hypothetical protein [Escherichia coli]
MTTDHRTTGHLTKVRHHLAVLQIRHHLAVLVLVAMDLQAVQEDQGITATGVEVDRVVAAKC